MLLEVKKIVVPPGQTIILQDINWSDFEAILDDLGEHRGSRGVWSKVVGYLRAIANNLVRVSLRLSGENNSNMAMS